MLIRIELSIGLNGAQFGTFNCELEIRNLAVQAGGAFVDSGSGFGKRDLGFLIPEEKADEFEQQAGFLVIQEGGLPEWIRKDIPAEGLAAAYRSVEKSKGRVYGKIPPLPWQPPDGSADGPPVEA